jgi:hypothetical protein
LKNTSMPSWSPDQGLKDPLSAVFWPWFGGVVFVFDPPTSQIATFSTAEEFCEVRGSKQPLRRSGKHSTTAWWHPFSVEILRLGSSSCTILYQGVATRNGVTTREILRYKILRHSIGA